MHSVGGKQSHFWGSRRAGKCPSRLLGSEEYFSSFESEKKPLALFLSSSLSLFLPMFSTAEAINYCAQRQPQMCSFGFQMNLKTLARRYVHKRSIVFNSGKSGLQLKTINPDLNARRSSLRYDAVISLCSFSRTLLYCVWSVNHKCSPSFQGHFCQTFFSHQDIISNFQ